MAVSDTFYCIIHRFYTICDSRGQGKIDLDSDDLDNTLEKLTFESFLVK